MEAKKMKEIQKEKIEKLNIENFLYSGQRVVEHIKKRAEEYQQKLAKGGYTTEKKENFFCSDKYEIQHGSMDRIEFPFSYICIVSCSDFSEKFECQFCIRLSSDATKEQNDVAKDLLSQIQDNRLEIEMEICKQKVEEWKSSREKLQKEIDNIFISEFCQPAKEEAYKEAREQVSIDDFNSGILKRIYTLLEETAYAKKVKDKICFIKIDGKYFSFEREIDEDEDEDG